MAASAVAEGIPVGPCPGRLTARPRLGGVGSGPVAWFPPWKWSASLVYAPARRCARAGGVRVRSARWIPPQWQPGLGRSAGSFYRGHLYVALPIKHGWNVGPTCASLASAFFSLLAYAFIRLQLQLQAGIGWVGPRRGRVNYGVVNELGCLIRANSGGD